MKMRPTGSLWFGAGFAATLSLSGTYGVYFTDGYKALPSSLAAMRQMIGVTAFAWVLAVAVFAAGAWLFRCGPTPRRAAVAGIVVAVLTICINYPIMLLRVPVAHAGWVSALLIGIACFFAARLASLGSPPKAGAVV